MNNGKIYILPDENKTRVRIVRTKEFPPSSNDPDWLKEIKNRKTYCLERVSDGHHFGVYNEDPQHFITAYHLKEFNES